MALTERHLHVARLIDDVVQYTFARGGNEEDILTHMIDYMECFKELLDSTTSAQMAELCERFDGVHVFASIMSDMAAGIADGTLQVPADPPGADTGNVHTLLPKLTVNRTFIQEFITAEPPCFALGLVDERKQTCGFLALRIDEMIPPPVLQSGFRFGHSLFGNEDFVVIHFAFEFYGFGTYNVLVNPHNDIVQTVLRIMLENQDYFFLSIDPDQQVTTFRSDLGETNLAGLGDHHPHIMRSTTTEAQYQSAVSQFARNPQPAGVLLNWVCRDTAAALDLVNDRLAMNPS